MTTHTHYLCNHIDIDFICSFPYRKECNYFQIALLTELVIALIQSDARTLYNWTNHNYYSVVASSARLATPTVAAKRVEMDESFFSDSILEFINDEEDEEF